MMNSCRCLIQKRGRGRGRQLLRESLIEQGKDACLRVLVKERPPSGEADRTRLLMARTTRSSCPRSTRAAASASAYRRRRALRPSSRRRPPLLGGAREIHEEIVREAPRRRKP